MDREQLTALRDVLTLILKLPDPVREQLAQWLAPETAKPNGHDPHPPPIAPTGKQPEAQGARTNLKPRTPVGRGSPAPYAGKVRQSAPFNMKAAEQRLLEALAERPGSTVATLARACVAGRSRTGERLRQLAAQGAIEKDPDGRWRLKREESRPPLQGAEAGPTPPPPN